jgi:TonB family protein
MSVYSDVPDLLPSSLELAQADPEEDFEALPPTLQPGAIFLAAPPPERGLPLLVTSNIYTLMLLAGLLWVWNTRAAQALAAKQTVSLTFEEVPDQADKVPLATVTGSPRAADSAEGTGTIDPRLLVLEPVLPMEARLEERQDLPLPLLHPAAPPADVHLPQAAGGTGLPRGDGHGGTHGIGKGGSGRAMIRGVPGMNPELNMNDLEIIHEEIPQYPVLAEWGQIQGDVVVRVTINEKGVPIRTELLEGPAQLQSETMRAIKLWRFGKGIFRGKSLNATFDMTFRYILR